ncbi:MAG: glycosyltransferase family 2 protein [Geobacteraceae bacterium]|nr:glycosyltransferase family 2 protein [Geobacteraceae bacterium]NTW80311.1 glycosyltransferase family 2 protein [Geobacteraceae bacterium]
MATCILIPAYNADITILPVVQECLEHGMPVVVVDDGSATDLSDLLAGLPVTLLRHRQNLGKGAALKTGFAWAIESAFDAVVTIDADGQHDVSAIPQLVSSAQNGGWGILIASRHAQFELMSGLRKLWNRIGVWCIWKRTGFEITDSQSGFRFYSRNVLKDVSLKSNGYALEMEILLKAWKRGFTVGSLPIAARVADGRATSHYRPVKDTVNISMTFLRYM